MDRFRVLHFLSELKHHEKCALRPLIGSACGFEDGDGAL
jgi:hypothetical protein